MANADATEQLHAQSEALSRQLNNQRELLRVTESILSTLDTQALLEEIADRLKTLVAGRQHLRRRPRRADEPCCARSSRAAFTPGSSWRRRWPTTRASAAYVLRTGEAQLVQDELTDDRVAHFPDLEPAGRRADRRAAAQRRPHPGRADDRAARRRGALRRRGVRAGQAVRGPRLDRSPERRGAPRGRAARRDRHADRALEPRRADRAHRRAWSRSDATSRC